MMLAVKIAQIVAAVAVAYLLALLEHRFHDRRTRRYKSLRLALLIFLGANGALAVWITIADERSKKIEIADLKGDLSSTRAALDRSMGELKQTQAELRRTSSAITGGASFPYVNVADGRLLLVNEGPDPLYDIAIRMWSPKSYAKDLTAAQWQALERQALHFSIATHPPHAVRDLGPVPLPRNTSWQLLQISLLARNGSFSEQLLFRRVGRTLEVGGYRVFRGQDESPGAKLLERTAPSLRNEGGGEALWDVLLTKASRPDPQPPSEGR